jgi:AraC family transcriptional regulator
MDDVSPGLRFAHAEMSPHVDTETRTGRFQIGVASSAHRDVCFSVGDRTRVATYAGGAMICSADEEIVWSRVAEPTEALEIYPDPTLVRRLSGGATTWPFGEALVGRRDPVVLGVASVLRRAVSPVPGSTLWRLAPWRTGLSRTCS